MSLRRNLSLLIAAITIVLITSVNTVSAAGSAAITIESAASGNGGTTQDLALYVTPSGVPLYTVQTTINLSNMTFVSYTPTATFALFNAAASGGSVGSTQFTIGASHSGNSETAAGAKTLIGTIRVQLSGSAGTATVTQSGAKAGEYATDTNNESPMSPVSSPSRSITITAPQAATCPAGQIGTPPNCTTPSSPSSGGSGSTGGTNPITNPNPNSSAVVPTAGSTIENPTADVISENQLSEVLSETQTPTETVATTTAKNKLPIPAIIGAIGVLVIAVVGAKIAMSKIAKSRELSNHVAGSSYTAPADQTAKSDDSDKTPPADTPPSGPTIIRPGQ